jgi:hypothetical protein
MGKFTCVNDIDVTKVPLTHPLLLITAKWNMLINMTKK